MQKTSDRKENATTSIAGSDPATPIEALRRIVRDVEELMSESGGVYGIKGDGSRVPWSELVAGTMSAWLGDGMHTAREALAHHSEQPAENLRASTDYQILAHVLQMALDQAQTGKGRERHANDQAFSSQPILNIARMLDGIDGHGFQVMKKTQEAVRMFHRGRESAAIQELLGAIVYSAAAVTLILERIGKRAAAI